MPNFMAIGQRVADAIFNKKSLSNLGTATSPPIKGGE